MSSPHLSFRLNHYHLAKALRILVTLEPNQPIPSLSQAAKIIILDWIAKHSIKTSLVASQADIEAVQQISEIPTAQINPFTTIQSAMSNALAKSTTPSFSQAQAKALAQELAPAQHPTHLTDQAQATRQREDAEGEELMRELKLSHESVEQESDRDKQINEQINLAFQSDQDKPDKPAKKIWHKAPEELEPSESVINTVTDFSPPTDLID